MQLQSGNRQATSEALDVEQQAATKTAMALKPHVSGAADGKRHSSGKPGVQVAVMTGGFDPHYAYGLALGLASHGVGVDLIASAMFDSPELHSEPNIVVRNLYWDPRKPVGLVGWLAQVLAFYARLVRYVISARPQVIHILWNNKFQFFDRTLLMLYYKLLGKKITLTAHNVNAAKRDSSDSFLNRLTLKCQYHLCDHIFVHTEKMKSELWQEFAVSADRVTVIPLGVNNAVPNTAITSAETRRKLGIQPGQKVMLFFGALRPYKGVEFLLSAFNQMAAANPDYRLILAAEPKKGSEKYFEQLLELIEVGGCSSQIIQRLEYIPDAEAELYFKAADISILPYTDVFQSGVLYLGYGFGLPAIATDVGSFREAVVEGQTGFLCKRCDATDLSRTIEKYFASDLFKTLKDRRQEIQNRVNDGHSWDVVVELTRDAYTRLLTA